MIKLNTKIYTTKLSVARDFARACGVENFSEEANAIGYAFTERSKAHNCIIAFQKDSGIDDGHFKGVTYKEISRAELKAINQSENKD